MDGNLKSKVSSIPTSPGIYFFKNNKDKIIYIGKAKSLRNRVRSYFSGIDKKDAKTQVMVRHIVDIDWMVVRSETEALLTEANLIKEHKPRYNVFLKDDKTFPYIRITNEDYPQIEIMRMKNLKKDKHSYFGPYTDAYYLREVLKSIHKIFPQTNQTLKHLKIEGPVPKDEYNEIIEKIKMFLKGRSGDVRFGIKQKMDEASENLRYEQAAKYRDQLNAIDNFISKQKKVSHDFMDRDIISMAADGISAVCMLIRIRNGHLVGRNRFLIHVADDKDIAGNVQGFILQHYSASMDYPKEILLREIKKYIEGPVRERRALGELDHPESSVINLQNVSHNVTKIKMVGDDVYGEVEILSTPAGNILKELFRNGITVGISSRGMGSVQESGNGTVEVQDDFELLCFDFVSTPSTHGAFMKPAGRSIQELQEGKIQVPEYKYTNVNNIIRDIICDNTGMCKC